MKLIKLLIILLLAVAVLLLIDLGTGIWYWNRDHLVLDAQNLNNVVTPIIAIFSLFVYGYTLRIAIRQNETAAYQNKVILSQNIKPYYEKEIEECIQKAKITELDRQTRSLGEPCTPFNYIRKINSQLIALMENPEYDEDYEQYSIYNRKEFDLEYIKSRSYYRIVLFLTIFTMPLSEIHFFYNDIQRLIEEIDQSNLIFQDKALLKKRIKRQLLEEYFAFIDLMKPESSTAVPFPCLYQSSTKYELPAKAEFKTLAETKFKDHYDWFKENIS